MFEGSLFKTKRYGDLIVTKYINHKEAYLKELANKWKDKIDPRVYEALIGWEINIDD